jgi:hypothetical protein
MIAAVGLGAVGGACTYTASPGNPGTLTIQEPGIVPDAPPPANAVPPPANLTAGAATNKPAAAGPPSGTYTGVGHAVTNPSDLCEDPLPINDFVVTGDAVSFGRFQGTIRPDGTVEMQGGDSYVYGKFTGNHFDGRFWAPGPSCTYQLSLNRSV